MIKTIGKLRPVAITSILELGFQGLPDNLLRVFKMMDKAGPYQITEQTGIRGASWVEVDTLHLDVLGRLCACEHSSLNSAEG